MTDELLVALKKAGTYKINYGIETASVRLQQQINKGLNAVRIKEVVDKTANLGIITSGYFILGFPTETVEEMNRTIDFACNSNLDNAYFFKLTDFSGVRFAARPQLSGPALNNLHFYSSGGSSQSISSAELNQIMLKAQQRFYLSNNRIWRGFLRTTRKGLFLKNLASIFVLLLQSYLVRKLTTTKS